jgi:hypothetical protein
MNYSDNANRILTPRNSFSPDFQPAGSCADKIRKIHAARLALVRI